MATAKTMYQGDFRCASTHLQSGNELLTDAPTDNNGKGEAFSPTDLVATALANCMLTIMDMTATAQNFTIKGAVANTTKIMSSNPRRISEIHIDFDLRTQSYSDKQKQILENAAKHCPVAKSIHPDISVAMKFNFQ